MLNFDESGHPLFRATSALERGELRSKEKGKKSIHVRVAVRISNGKFCRFSIDSKSSFAATSESLDNCLHKSAAAP